MLLSTEGLPGPAMMNMFGKPETDAVWHASTWWHFPNSISSRHELSGGA